VIITSTDEGAKVTAIYFGDKLVFNAPDGLGARGFERGGHPPPTACSQTGVFVL